MKQIHKFTHKTKRSRGFINRRAIDSDFDQSDSSVVTTQSLTTGFRKCSTSTGAVGITHGRSMFRLFQCNKTQLKPVFLSRGSIKMATERGDSTNSVENRSIHSDTIEEVHNVPLQVIIRPLPPVLDELKVQSLMDTIQVI